jgi:hypothetical protein
MAVAPAVANTPKLAQSTTDEGSGISGSAPLTAVAADTDGKLVLSGTKSWDSPWTTKLMMDGHYIGTIHDHQPDGAWSFHTTLPAAGTHTIEVYLDDTGTAAIDSITIPPPMSRQITAGNFEFTNAADPYPVPISGEMVNDHSAKIFVKDASLGTVWEQTFQQTMAQNGTVLSDVAFGPWQPVRLHEVTTGNFGVAKFDGSFTAPIPDGAGHLGPGGTHVADFVKVVTFPGLAGASDGAYSTWLAHG